VVHIDILELEELKLEDEVEVILVVNNSDEEDEAEHTDSVEVDDGDDEMVLDETVLETMTLKLDEEVDTLLLLQLMLF
jgi:hypothetical protein